MLFGLIAAEGFAAGVTASGVAADGADAEGWGLALGRKKLSEVTKRCEFAAGGAFAAGVAGATEVWAGAGAPACGTGLGCWAFCAFATTGITASINVATLPKFDITPASTKPGFDDPALLPFD